jgi:RND family efflux transporter MFP subunit
LFVVSDVRKLRVYVNVPQTYVPNVAAGTKATVIVPEHPERSYAAVVDNSSQAITAASGTTLMQLVVENRGAELLPGSYANVRLQLPSNATALSVPASALIYDANGLRLATVDSDNRVTVKSVTIARDLGSVIEIGSGIAADDRIIQNPPDGIATGAEVRIAGKPAEPAEKPKSAKG